MKTLGTLKLEDGKWLITAQPHVMIKIKRCFDSVYKSSFGTVSMTNTDEVCADLEWFIQRYPLETLNEKELLEGSARYRRRKQKLEEYLKPDFVPEPYETALPPRQYQAQAIEVYKNNGFLLVGDAFGLGKTVVGACSLADPRLRPGLIVCSTHLAHQWREEIKKFMPQLSMHTIDKTKPYSLKPHDVYIITYSKLAGWGDIFCQEDFIKSVCFDEVQALRHSTSQKSQAAVSVSKVVPFRLALSATPFFNYGGEMFNIMEVLSPGLLGTYQEFCREWCDYGPGGKFLFKDPNAFGSYLRDNCYMLARTREDVGRELPPITKVPYTIGHDPKALDAIKSSALSLAKLLLDETAEFTSRGRASREFDLKLRMATGIAKAPFAAEFIKMLIEDGERPVVFAWHREVYFILMEALREYNPVMFTGSENAAQKEQSRRDFVSGKSKCFIISTRSGEGLNGLQDASSVTVHVELDWTGAVHDQNITRVARDRTDGKENKVVSYFLLSDIGSDPVMGTILGLKSAQIKGMMSADGNIETGEVDPERIKTLAREFLAKHQ